MGLQHMGNCDYGLEDTPQSPRATKVSLDEDGTAFEAAEVSFYEA